MTLGKFSTLPDRLEKAVTLPSGRQAVVLEMTGKEEALFRDLSTKKVADVTTKFLCSVTKSLDGNSEPVTREAIESMLVGDRTAILLHVRDVTHGPLVNFHIDCTNCHKSSEHEFSIEPVLAGIEPYPHGAELVHSIDVDGAKLFFELPTGKTERKISEFKTVDVNSKIAAMRIWEETPDGTLPVHLESLRSRHLAALRKAVKDLECRIDKTVSLVCPHCGEKFALGLTENPDFLFPGLT